MALPARYGDDTLRDDRKEKQSVGWDGMTVTQSALITLVSASRTDRGGGRTVGVNGEREADKGGEEREMIMLSKGAFHILFLSHPLPASKFPIPPISQIACIARDCGR